MRDDLSGSWRTYRKLQSTVRSLPMRFRPQWCCQRSPLPHVSPTSLLRERGREELASEVTSQAKFPEAGAEDERLQALPHRSRRPGEPPRPQGPESALVSQAQRAWEISGTAAPSRHPGSPGGQPSETSPADTCYDVDRVSEISGPAPKHRHSGVQFAMQFRLSSPEYRRVHKEEQQPVQRLLS